MTPLWFPLLRQCNTMMKVSVAIYILLLNMLVVLADDESNRFFAGGLSRLIPMTTSVKYVVPTVTSFTTVAVTCYSAVDVTGQCKRRRRRHLAVGDEPIILTGDGEMFDIDTILPTPTRKIETTSLPDWESKKKRTDDEDVESSLRKPQEENVRGALTITINTPDWLFNKSKKLIRNPGFGVTYVNLATSTLASVSLSTLTQNAISSFFIVSRCVPIGFPYSSCGQETDSTASLTD